MTETLKSKANISYFIVNDFLLNKNVASGVTFCGQFFNLNLFHFSISN